MDIDWIWLLLAGLLALALWRVVLQLALLAAVLAVLFVVWTRPGFSVEARAVATLVLVVAAGWIAKVTRIADRAASDRSGRRADSPQAPCYRCNGSGRVDCTACFGGGAVLGRSCPSCGGARWHACSCGR